MSPNLQHTETPEISANLQQTQTEEMSGNLRQSEKAETCGANDISDEDDGFTIRDYVASVRETDIRKCWPLPMNILDSYLSRGMAPPLPPLRTAPKKSRRKTVPPARHQIRDDDNESRKEAQIPLYSEGGKVAPNEGELVNSSSDAGQEPNTSMEPFPDAAECPISLGSESPTFMATNAASLSLPIKKRRHSMAEAQMHKGKKRKVRTKLQQNVGMDDKLSHQNVGKMIAPRTQPLAGDNCNDLPNNEVSVLLSIDPS